MSVLSALVVSFLTIHHRGIFPLVIMFIGTENMFSLVRVEPPVEILFCFLSRPRSRLLSRRP